jgi:solute carrier family 25 protein 39/40
MGAVVALPFDRIKSRMQVSGTARRMGAWALAKNILAAQGLRGLYKGGTPHMLIAPYTVFYYSVYDELLSRGRAASSGTNGHALIPLGAAIIARTIETCVRQPLELLRTMMQTSDASVTLGGCLRTLSNQPLPSWFRGIGPTLARDVPFSAIYWCGYEEAKTRVVLPRGPGEASGGLHIFMHSFVCGAGAGIVAAVATAPSDVVKTVRQQAAADASYSQILATIREQPRLALAGLGPRLIRIPAGLATMMAGLEASKRWFERRRAEKLLR